MPARTQATGATALREVFFLVDGQLGMARRFGRDYFGCDRWRGWKLCGLHNRRAAAALVSLDRSVPAKLVRIVPASIQDPTDLGEIF